MARTEERGEFTMAQLKAGMWVAAGLVILFTLGFVGPLTMWVGAGWAGVGLGRRHNTAKQRRGASMMIGALLVCALLIPILNQQAGGLMWAAGTVGRWIGSSPEPVWDLNMAAWGVAVAATTAWVGGLGFAISVIIPQGSEYYDPSKRAHFRGAPITLLQEISRFADDGLKGLWGVEGVTGQRKMSAFRKAITKIDKDEVEGSGRVREARWLHRYSDFFQGDDRSHSYLLDSGVQYKVDRPIVGWTTVDGVERVLTSTNRVRRTAMGKIVVEGHILVAGPTSSGKTTRVVSAHIHQPWSGPKVVFSSKADLVGQLQQAAEAHGKRFFLLDPFGITGQPSATLDVRSGIATLSEAKRRVDRVVRPDGEMHQTSDGGEYFRNVSTTIAASFFLCTNLIGQDYRTINEFLSKDIDGYMRQLHSAAEPYMEPFDHARMVEDWGVLSDLADTKVGETWRNVLGSMRNHLSVLLQSELVHMSRAAGPEVQTLNLEQVISSGDYLMVVDPGTDASVEATRAMSMFMDQLQQAIHGIAKENRSAALEAGVVDVEDEGRLAQTLWIISDETANSASFKDLPRLLSWLRGFGVIITHTWQDLGQVERVHGKGKDSIVSNSKVLQILGGYYDSQENEALRRLVGQSVQTRGSSTTRDGGADSEGEADTVTSLLSGHELLTMDKTKVIVVIQGVGPVRAKTRFITAASVREELYWARGEQKTLALQHVQPQVSAGMRTDIAPIPPASNEVEGQAPLRAGNIHDEAKQRSEAPLVDAVAVTTQNSSALDPEIDALRTQVAVRMPSSADARMLADTTRSGSTLVLPPPPKPPPVPSRIQPVRQRNPAQDWSHVYRAQDQSMAPAFFAPRGADVESPSGPPCDQCGGMTTRSGTCLTCAPW